MENTPNTPQQLHELRDAISQKQAANVAWKAAVSQFERARYEVSLARQAKNDARLRTALLSAEFEARAAEFNARARVQAVSPAIPLVLDAESPVANDAPNEPS